MYRNIYEYLAANMICSTDRFSITVTDHSMKKPDELHIMIHPENRNGETADFLISVDGSEKYVTEL